MIHTCDVAELCDNLIVTEARLVLAETGTTAGIHPWLSANTTSASQRACVGYLECLSQGSTPRNEHVCSGI